jgi:hypothetical protein
MFLLAQTACYDDCMETYGYPEDSELNLAEEVQQQYQITDVDMLYLLASIRDAVQSEQAQGFSPQTDMLRHVQKRYRLSKKDHEQLVHNLSTLCVFPHHQPVSRPTPSAVSHHSVPPPKNTVPHASATGQFTRVVSLAGGWADTSTCNASVS